MSFELRVIRIKLPDNIFRKYKVYCAINNISVTEQTNKLVRKFVQETEKEIKVIKLDDT